MIWFMSKLQYFIRPFTMKMTNNFIRERNFDLVTCFVLEKKNFDFIFVFVYGTCPKKLVSILD